MYQIKKVIINCVTCTCIRALSIKKYLVADKIDSYVTTNLDYIVFFTTRSQKGPWIGENVFIDILTIRFWLHYEFVDRKRCHKNTVNEMNIVVLTAAKLLLIYRLLQSVLYRNQNFNIVTIGQFFKNIFILLTNILNSRKM